MSSIYDLDQPGPAKKEIALARQDAAEYLRVWRSRALFATAAFVLSCMSVVPFLYGHSLHAYWETFGKYLVLLSMALLIPFGVCVGVMINSWYLVRNLRKDKL